MEIKELLEPIELDYENREGNLDVEAVGVVKSKKNFPVFIVGDEEKIFKPLSKTKPLTTEMFSYAEVYWSYVINKYFDSRTPLYRLAKCHKIEEKYYENGTLVRKIGTGKFTNLLEYFNMYPEDGVDIKDYVNYCMIDYDYTKILHSNFVSSNRAVGEELSFQILLSILRMDQNFHYENINMDGDNGYTLIPPIDFEFSTPFLYPENLKTRSFYMDKYFNHLTFPTDMHYALRGVLGENFDPVSILVKNIYWIVKDYPDIVDRFMDSLDRFYQDIDEIDLSDDYSFIGDVSSEYWMIGHARYKDKDLSKAEELEGQIKKIPVDKSELFELIKSDNKRICLRLKSIIKGIRIMMSNGIDNLEDMTIDRLYSIICNGVKDENVKYDDVLRKVLEYK